MSQSDAVIIGAGTAGLFCALMLAEAGKQVLVIERQAVPGGLNTTFKRKGFTFEASLHCVDALGEAGQIREFLREHGLDERLGFIELGEFCRFIYPGHDIKTDFDPVNFLAKLKIEFPAEQAELEKLFAALKGLYKEFDSFSGASPPLWLRFLVAPFLYPRIYRLQKLSLEEFISAYLKDKQAKALLCDLWRFAGLAPQRLSALYFLLVFRGYYFEPTAYVRGGFSNFFNALAEKIKELGSELRFNTSVEKIITGDKKRVRSVITDKGEEIGCRVVVSNADVLNTLTRLLDEPSQRQYYRDLLSGMENSVSAFQVYLGLDTRPQELGLDYPIYSLNTSYDHQENFAYSQRGDYERCPLALVDHSRFDPGLAPAGKGTLLLMCLDNYSRWLGLSPEDYRAQKKVVTGILIRRAEKYLPGLSGHIEVLESATPLTIARFAGVSEGAIYGFAQTPAQAFFRRLGQETKIKGLFLAGAWTRPGGGLHSCFISGLDAADLALKYLANCR